MRNWLAALGLMGLVALPQTGSAVVVYTPLASPLTTVANTGGGCCDGTGIWFNPLTAYAEERGFFFPTPLNADGLYFLLLDAANSSPPEALIYTQGLFSRGNGVVYASSSNLNPAWFGVGASIGPSTGFQSPGAGFPDIGPNFGNGVPGRGFVGLTIRDPSGAASSDVFYGFADITLDNNYVITLNGFAYENVRGAAITTFIGSPVPEPAAGWAFALGLVGIAAASWRSRRRADV